jgi:hypothetical protein
LPMRSRMLVPSGLTVVIMRFRVTSLGCAAWLFDGDQRMCDS